VPGLGTKSVDKLISARRHLRLRLADLARVTASIARVEPFVVTVDHRPHGLDRLDLRRRLVKPAEQLSLFA
jgi:predicted DNA-binding helix-hairpin-helix protein